MTEFVIFLVDLGLVVAASAVAVVVYGRMSSLLATGLYALLTGVGLIVVPIASWDVARTDNAFLGLYLIGVFAVILGAILLLRALLRLRWEPRRRPGQAVGVGLVAAVVALGVLAVRGPGAWATGSGQFGLDVVVAGVLVGVATFIAARRLARREVPRPD